MEDETPEDAVSKDETAHDRLTRVFVSEVCTLCGGNRLSPCHIKAKILRPGLQYTGKIYGLSPSGTQQVTVEHTFYSDRISVFKVLVEFPSSSFDQYNKFGIRTLSRLTRKRLNN